ncbi:CRISPR/Cas system-associated protein endoribonuclease Cas2 [Anaerotaenia torta]|uniref:leucine-rich repeat protein n=1 Tax=Anaerotaenia torta TaxID=433293 RepID=UPI003D2003BD
MKKIMDLFKGAVTILLILSLINIPMQVARAGDNVDVIGNEYGEMFYTHETEEYKANPTDSLLIYKALLYFGDSTDMVSVTGSYVFDKKGNVDESSCAENVVIPETVTWNGKTYKVVATNETFKGKRMLKKVSLPNSIIKIRTATFSMTGIFEIYIPKNVTLIYDTAFLCCTELKKIAVSEENLHFKTDSKALYSKDGKDLLFTINLNRKTITIQEGVENVYSCALSTNMYFEGTHEYGDYVEKVIFPSTIKLIGSGALPISTKIVEFKGKTLPKVGCDLSYAIIKVPKGYEKIYKKLSHSAGKLESSQVISSIKNLSANEKVINALVAKEDFKAIKPTDLTNKQWKEMKNLAEKLTKDCKTQEDKALAIYRWGMENIVLNEDLFKYGFGNPKYASDYGRL